MGSIHDEFTSAIGFYYLNGLLGKLKPGFMTEFDKVGLREMSALRDCRSMDTWFCSSGSPLTNGPEHSSGISIS